MSETIGPQLNSLQRKEMYQSLIDMLGPGNHSGRYTEVVDQCLHKKENVIADHHNNQSLCNAMLKTQIEDQWYQKVDELIDNGELPHMEGEAQNVLDQAVKELTEMVIEQIQITSEDVHDYLQRVRERNDRLQLNDDLDHEYESHVEQTYL